MGAGSQSPPRVVAFDGRSLLSRNPIYAASFFAGDPNSHSGAKVAMADVDGDGRADIIITPGTNSDGLLRVYFAAGDFVGSAIPGIIVQSVVWATHGSSVG